MDAFNDMTPEQKQTLTENRNMAAQAMFRPPTQAARKRRLMRRQRIIDLNAKLRQAGVRTIAWGEHFAQMGDEEFDDLLLQHENDMTEATQQKAEAEFFAPQRPQPQPQPQPPVEPVLVPFVPLYSLPP